MAHFAKVENGIVVNVIVAEQSFIDTLPDKSSWIQTSYNTIGGRHLTGGTPLRKNYAGVGFTYDPVRDAFIPPAFENWPSWTLDEETCLWNAPIPYPDDGKDYAWDEEKIQWVEYVIPTEPEIQN